LILIRSGKATIITTKEQTETSWCRASDGATAGNITVKVPVTAGYVERSGTIHHQVVGCRYTSGIFNRAAAWGDRARAEGCVVAKINRSRTERRAPGVGIRTRQNQRARAALGNSESITANDGGGSQRSPRAHIPCLAGTQGEITTDRSRARSERARINATGTKRERIRAGGNRVTRRAENHTQGPQIRPEGHRARRAGEGGNVRCASCVAPCHIAGAIPPISRARIPRAGASEAAATGLIPGKIGRTSTWKRTKSETNW